MTTRKQPMTNGQRHVTTIDVGQVCEQIEKFRNSMTVKPSFKAATEIWCCLG